MGKKRSFLQFSEIEIADSCTFITLISKRDNPTSRWVIRWTSVAGKLKFLANSRSSSN